MEPSWVLKEVEQGGHSPLLWVLQSQRSLHLTHKKEAAVPQLAHVCRCSGEGGDCTVAQGGPVQDTA